MKNNYSSKLQKQTREIDITKWVIIGILFVAGGIFVLITNMITARNISYGARAFVPSGNADCRYFGDKNGRPGNLDYCLTFKKGKCKKGYTKTQITCKQEPVKGLSYTSYCCRQNSK